MAKDLAVTFKGIRFRVDLSEDLAQYVRQDLSINGVAFDRDNDLRKLLTAYLKKSDEVFRLERRLDAILERLEKLDEEK
ncbi:MAG: hypothetical protein ACQERK_04845 [Campylobacterota bacterium]